jgi:hypothetical protein
MLNTRKTVLVILAVAALLGSVSSKAWARGDNAQPRPPQVLAEQDVKDLILLLDTDKNGKVSKEEFMKFMEAEFDRLDKDKSGELDVRELRESRFRLSNFSSAGK